MDKYEYKIRAEEIRALNSQKKYAQAAKIADTIDWSRVKSVMMLCTVSDVYNANRRYDDAKALLEMANERHPGGRMIIYSLCELAIKMGDVLGAIEYYKQFVQIAPGDSSRYVLQYKLYEAQDVSLEERIGVLEEMKKKEYKERWAYELAYLYHRVGLATKCVEECDELILWFGEGKYVMKAMELKLLHQPLSPAQQQKFDAYMMRKQGLNVPGDSQKSAGGKGKGEQDIQVKAMDMGKYNTLNLQKELAESMKEVWQNGQTFQEGMSLQQYREQLYQEQQRMYGYGQDQGYGYDQAQSGYDGSQAGYDGNQYGYDAGQAGYDGNQYGYDAGQAGYDGNQYGYDQNQVGYDMGQYGYDQSQPGYGQPAYDYGQAQPGYDAGSYGYDAGQPGYGQGYDGDQAGYGRAQGGYDVSQSGYGQTQPGYGQTQYEYDQTQSGYGQEQYSYDQTQSGYDPEQYGYDQSQRGYGQEQYGYDQARPGYDTDANDHAGTQSGQTQYGYGQDSYRYDTQQYGYGDMQAGYGSIRPEETDVRQDVSTGWGEAADADGRTPQETGSDYDGREQDSSRSAGSYEENGRAGYERGRRAYGSMQVYESLRPDYDAKRQEYESRKPVEQTNAREKIKFVENMRAADSRGPEEGMRAVLPPQPGPVPVRPSQAFEEHSGSRTSADGNPDEKNSGSKDDSSREYSAGADERQVEKQITGQMNIEDVMKEWEKVKQVNEEKRRRQLQDRMQEETGTLLRDFDTSSREGVLEKLQKEEQIPVESRRQPSDNVISAQTKIWAAEEVNNALKRASSAPDKDRAGKEDGAETGNRPEAVPNAGLLNRREADGRAPEGGRRGSDDTDRFVPEKGMPIADRDERAAEPDSRKVQENRPVGKGPEEEKLRTETDLHGSDAAMPEMPRRDTDGVEERTQRRMSERDAGPAEEEVRLSQTRAPQGTPVRGNFAQENETESIPGENMPGRNVREDQPGEGMPRRDMRESQPEGNVPEETAVEGMPRRDMREGQPEGNVPEETAAESMPRRRMPEERPAGNRIRRNAQEGFPEGDMVRADVPEEITERGVSRGSMPESRGRRMEPKEGREKNRGLSPEEKRLFSSFVPTKGAMKRMTGALDKLSLAAYTGNLIITGDPGSDTMELAKNVIKDMREKDRNFSGKLAKMSGPALNGGKKDPSEIIEKLSGGAIIIERAGEIGRDGMQELLAALDQDSRGILVILIDTKRNIRTLETENPEMEPFFNARFDIEALDNGTLVAYGCQYAKMQEYAIDELGRLALHTCIEGMQTIDHVVTVKDVREIVNRAIDHANKKTPKHFMDVILAKRYDDDDMIILHEGDFIIE